MNELTSVSADRVVDARAMACPGPLLEAKRSVGLLAVGQVLELVCADRASREDLPAWCRKAGHDYLGWLERNHGDSHFIQRKR